MKIIVAAHKPCIVPKNEIYLPLQVGAAGKDSFGFQRDDEGENISVKNPFYCELTGVYWAWKNLEDDIIGIVHYRRYFGIQNKNDFYSGVIKEQEIKEILHENDVIVAKPRNYYIEDIRTHFHNHIKVFTDVNYIEFLEKAVKSTYPEYEEDLEKCFSRKKAHMYNMFVMRKKEFDEYCVWLFDILEYMESNHKNFTDKDEMLRIYGFIGELLLDVYLTHNHKRIYEKQVIEKDTQAFIIKAFNFCKRKFLGIR